jgi:nitrogen fixation/metabolism regulation signal transduction histidine kinase
VNPESGDRAASMLAAVLDAVDVGVFVFDAEGRIVTMSRWARERFLGHLGRVPATLEEIRLGVEPRRPDGAAEPLLPAERALRGERVDTELIYSDGRRLHVQAVPVIGPDGAVQGAVSVSRDITDLHAAIAGRARLDGAVKTSRLLAHEINNQLALMVGYGTLLTGQVDGEVGKTIATMVEAAEQIAELVHRLQGIVRFEETDLGGGPMLDLEKATSGRTRQRRGQRVPRRSV